MIAKKAVKITSLPKDVLITIKSYLGRHKQIFMIAILSSKECDEYRNRTWECYKIIYTCKYYT